MCIVLETIIIISLYLSYKSFVTPITNNVQYYSTFPQIKNTKKSKNLLAESFVGRLDKIIERKYVGR